MPFITALFLAYVAGLLSAFGDARWFALGVLALVGYARSWRERALLCGVVACAVMIAEDAMTSDRQCRRNALQTQSVVLTLTSELTPVRGATGLILAACRVPVRLRARARVPAGSQIRVQGLVSRSGAALVVRDATANVLAPPNLAARIRARLSDLIGQRYGVWAPLAKALTIADQRDVDVTIRERFADAGIIHMLSVSGLHVSIIAGALLAAFAAVGAPSRTATVGSIGLTVVYVGLIGAPPPAVRSIGMCGLTAASRLVQRPTSAWAIWAVGSGFSLVEPRVVLDLGWQLSVAGMAGLIASGEFLKRQQLVWAGWRRALAENLIATGIASVASAPLVAWEFGRVSVAALLTNLAAAPLFNVVQPLLFASILAAPMGALSQFLADAARSALWLVDLVARIGASLPGATVRGAPDQITALCLGGAAVATLLACISAAPRRWGITALLCLGAVVWVPLLSISGNAIEIVMVDVGQGDALAIRSPRGRWLLVDAGGAWQGGDVATRTVLPFVRRRGGRVVHLVMTHPHLDHIGGARTVLDSLGVDSLWDSGYVEPNSEYAAVLQRARDRGVVWQRADVGDSIALDGVTIDVLSPDSAWTASRANPNDASVVLRLRFGEFAMLFTGDAEHEQEDELVRRFGDQLAATALKVGHHGSNTSSWPEFLHRVRPALALISVGVGNRYRHPSPEVLQSLHDVGADVLRTDDVGTIILRTDGRRVTVLADGLKWDLPLTH